MKSMLIVLLVAVTFAGCVNDVQGQKGCTGSSAAFNGVGETQCVITKDCPGTGTISWSHNLGSGHYSLDLQGAEFSRTFSSNQGADSQSIVGQPGSWSLTVASNAEFTGQYYAELRC